MAEEDVNLIELGSDENLWDKLSPEQRTSYLTTASEIAKELANSLGVQTAEERQIIEDGYIARFERLAQTPKDLIQKQVRGEEPINFTPAEQRELRLEGELLQRKSAQASIHQN